jgi:hypothetical protein
MTLTEQVFYLTTCFGVNLLLLPPMSAHIISVSEYRMDTLTQVGISGGTASVLFIAYKVIQYINHRHIRSTCFSHTTEFGVDIDTPKNPQEDAKHETENNSVEVRVAPLPLTVRIPVPHDTSDAQIGVESHELQTPHLKPIKASYGEHI